MTNNSTQVQEMLHQIKTEIEASGETCDLVSFRDFWEEKYAAKDTGFYESAFLGDVNVLLANNQLSYYQELTSYRSGASALVKPVKRLIRKAVAFLFLPLVAAQNNINLAIARLFIHMRSYVNRDRSEREQLVLRDRELELQLSEQKALISALQAQVEELSARLDTYEKGDK